MAKQLSRPKRWAEQTRLAREAYDELVEAAEKLREALQDLDAIREEYIEWYGNLPESLQDSPVGEKLAAIEQMELDVEVDLSEYEEAIDNAESAELPMGFGRD